LVCNNDIVPLQFQVVASSLLYKIDQSLVRSAAKPDFRKLGFIDYNGGIEVHSSLLNVVLHDQPQIKN